MSKKKKNKNKDAGSGLSQAAVSVAETLAGLINTPIGRQIVADALIAAAAALVRNRDEAGKAVAHAGAEAAEAVGEAAGKARSTAEVAVGIVGEAATRLVSSLVAGDETKANGAVAKTAEPTPEKKKKRSQRGDNAAPPALGDTAPAP